MENTLCCPRPNAFAPACHRQEAVTILLADRAGPTGGPAKGNEVVNTEMTHSSYSAQ